MSGMKKITIVFLLICATFFEAAGQSGVRDSTIYFPLISVSYGAYMPEGDLKDRFGFTNILGGNLLFKTKKNFIWGVTAGYIFGNDVKEPGLLSSITTKDGLIIGLDGLYAEMRIFERGYHLNATFGKVFTFNKPNPNSGIVIMGGPGFIQHKIRIENIGNTVPALRGDYIKGYDRLTNGFQLQEYIGFVYFSNRQLVNFYGGFDFIQGFTEGRRDYNFDNPEQKDNKKRIDLLFGIKIGWVVPLYKKKPAAYYLY